MSGTPASVPSVALSDRYHNIRRPKKRGTIERTDSRADIVAIVKARPGLAEFKRQFERQFEVDLELGSRVNKILSDFFRDVTAPGDLLYEEYLAATLPTGRETQREIREDSALAHRILQRIIARTKALG